MVDREQRKEGHQRGSGRIELPRTRQLTLVSLIAPSPTFHLKALI